jgi:asparagine synthetase B (glutamine-hydrolysing)
MSVGIYPMPATERAEGSCFVGLGHVRLAIIDLETGQQPLHDDEGTVHAVVTGELYDYERLRAELENQGARFQTHSDSELVVQLYVGISHKHTLCSHAALFKVQATWHKPLILASRRVRLRAV